MTATMTRTPLLTGWDALRVIRQCDQLSFAGRIHERNALLRTVDPSMWNGREILPVARNPHGQVCSCPPCIAKA